jgi:hypothetical protein
MDRDRDLDGVPDWQEDENYADEAPIAGPGSPRARMRGGGCALPVALLLTGVALAARRVALLLTGVALAARRVATGRS